MVNILMVNIQANKDYSLKVCAQTRELPGYDRSLELQCPTPYRKSLKAFAAKRLGAARQRNLSL